MKRRMVCGVGFDSKGKYKSSDGSKPTKIYSVWRGMIERCYNPKQLIRRPNYVGCTVCEEWHDFQNFAKWYDTYPYKGVRFQLDKDILITDNKVYSPETCCLVPREINMLFTVKKRGRYPQGVSFNKNMGKHTASLSNVGGSKHLGYFDCPNEAHQVYKKAKEYRVKEMADLWFGNIEPRVYGALMDWELES